MASNREIIKLAEEQNGKVFNAIANATDNAGQTLIDQGRRAARFDAAGNYSDEMVSLTMSSLCGILGDWKTSDDVRAWFAQYGIEA